MAARGMNSRKCFPLGPCSNHISESWPLFELIFAALKKAKSYTENIIGLNLVAAKLTTVPVTKFPL
jgi:hypothetical protein